MRIICIQHYSLKDIFNQRFNSYSYLHNTKYFRFHIYIHTLSKLINPH